MKKVTIRSINEALPRRNYYLRNYKLHGSTGVFDSGMQTLSEVWADYTDDGKCTGFYDYGTGEARSERHYYGWRGTSEVSGVIEEWMRGEIDRREVCRQIQEEIVRQENI